MLGATGSAIAWFLAGQAIKIASPMFGAAAEFGVNLLLPNRTFFQKSLNFIARKNAFVLTCILIYNNADTVAKLLYAGAKNGYNWYVGKSEKKPDDSDSDSDSDSKSIEAFEKSNVIKLEDIKLSEEDKKILDKYAASKLSTKSKEMLNQYSVKVNLNLLDDEKSEKKSEINLNHNNGAVRIKNEEFNFKDNLNENSIVYVKNKKSNFFKIF